MAERPVIYVVSLVKVQCGEHMGLIKDHMQDLVLIIILHKYLQVRAVYVLKLGKTWAKFVGPHVVSTASVRIWEHADTP